MSKFLPHQINHLELIEELKQADPSFPGNPTEVKDVGDLEVPFYPGMHKVSFDNGSVYYVKNSDGLAKHFVFDDETVCREHLDVYETLHKSGFYHPATRFIASAGEHG